MCIFTTEFQRYKDKTTETLKCQF